MVLVLLLLLLVAAMLASTLLVVEMPLVGRVALVWVAWTALRLCRWNCLVGSTATAQPPTQTISYGDCRRQQPTVTQSQRRMMAACQRPHRASAPHPREGGLWPAPLAAFVLAGVRKPSLRGLRMTAARAAVTVTAST